MHMVDVGGQRPERAKWSELVKECETVLFVTSLDDYHKTLDEDANKNRLREALVTYRQVKGLANKHIPAAHSLLFLNKTDLFEESMKTKPFNEYFPEYDGAVDEDGKATPAGAKEWVNAQFEDIHEKLAPKDAGQFTGHLTSALDTGHMRKVRREEREGKEG